MEGLKRGILGGSFNPVHLGHLIIAEDVRAALGLDEVLFVPAPRPWMKGDEELVSIQHRCRMVELAIMGNRGFRASRVDVERPGLSFTVDTLRDLRATEPAAYFFIMGMDTLATLPRWKDVQQLTGLCTIAAVGRPAIDRAAVLAQVEKELPGVSARITMVEAAMVDISSADIRRRCRSGQSIRYHVPESVEEYIRTNRLYL